MLLWFYGDIKTIKDIPWIYNFFIRGNLGYTKAIGDLTQAIKLDPADSKAYFNRGIVFGEIGNPQAAIRDFDTAIVHDPTYAKAYFERGLIKRDIGHRDAAAADFQKAKSLNPQLNPPNLQ